MCQHKNKNLSIEIKGVPKLLLISKDEFDVFISDLEFEIRNYYKDKKKDKNLPP